MKPIIYHTGITPPPDIQSGEFEVLHTSTIAVEFKNHHIPQDIAEFLKIEYWTTIVIYKNNEEIYRSIGKTKETDIFSAIQSTI